MIHFKETQYGFEFGAVKIERTASFPDQSVVVILSTPKQLLEVRITKSGLIRISPIKENKG